MIVGVGGKANTIKESRCPCMANMYSIHERAIRMSIAILLMSNRGMPHHNLPLVIKYRLQEPRTLRVGYFNLQCARN